MTMITNSNGHGTST
nr:truncated, non-functional lacZ alpha peptide [unidentified cloning vector]